MSKVLVLSDKERDILFSVLDALEGKTLEEFVRKNELEDPYYIDEIDRTLDEIFTKLSVD